MAVFVKLYYALSELKLCGKLEELTAEEDLYELIGEPTFMRAKAYTEVLTHFATLTEDLQTQSSFIVSYVLQRISDIRSNLGTLATGSNVESASLASSLLESFDNRPSRLFSQINPLLLASSFHPRYYHLPWIATETAGEGLRLDIESVLEKTQEDIRGDDFDVHMFKATLGGLRRHFTKKFVNDTSKSDEQILLD